MPLVFVFLPEVLSYAYGPPIGTCASMFPNGHGVEAQTTEPPYTISVNATTYRPNDVIQSKSCSKSKNKIQTKSIKVSYQYRYRSLI
jgi:hypothetical protein